MLCACAVLLSVARTALQYFSTLSHKRHDIKKNVIEYKMCVSISSTTLVWNISHSKKKLARYDQKRVLVQAWSPLHACTILMKLEIFSKDFQKYSNIKFNENPSSERRAVPFWQTDGQSGRRTNTTNLLTAAFHNFANAPKHNYHLQQARETQDFEHQKLKFRALRD